MPSTPHSLLNFIRTVASAWSNDPRDDDELLARFVDGRDEVAFQTLVCRHAPMVWRTCKRVLKSTSDAEDAFQVTFVALTRKAGELRGRTLAGWLHQVARRTALNAEIDVRRRCKLEQQPAVVVRTEEKDASRTELQALLDEELAGLPEKIRIPLVLRYLEEKTQDEVARILGCSRSAAQRRLAKAETILRERLERRGFTLGAVSLTTLLGDTGGVPAVPGRLIESTAQAAVAFRAGTLTGVTADGAENLLRLLSMKRALWKSWWLALACVGLLVIGGAGLLTWRMVAEYSDAVKPKTLIAPNVHEASDKPEDKRHVDRCGDPLPEGAFMRLGTIRFRNGSSVRPLFFLNDGKGLVAEGENDVLLYEVPGGKLIRSLNLWPEAVGHDWRTWPAAASVDGQLLAIASGKSRSGSSSGRDIDIWNLLTGKHVCQLKGHADEVRAMIFLSGDKILASGADDWTVRYWDVSTGAEIRRVKIPKAVAVKGCTNGMAFAPNGRTLAVGSSAVREFDGIVAAIDLDSGKLISEMKTSVSYLHLVFSADGRKLAMAAYGEGQSRWIRLWDVFTGKELFGQKKDNLETRGLALSPDGTILALTENYGEIVLWDVKAGKALHTLKACDGLRGSMVFSIDGKTLAMGAVYGRIIQMSPEGRGATGVSQHSIQLWDVSSGKQLTTLEGHEHAVWQVAFAPDGKNLATCDRNTVLLWDIDTGKLSSQQLRENKGQERSHYTVTYSPDNKRLATGEWNGEVGLWDAVTGERLHMFQGFKDQVHTLTFAPDSQTLVGCGETSKLWHMTNNQQRQGNVVYEAKDNTRNGIPVRRALTVAFSPNKQNLALYDTHEYIMKPDGHAVENPEGVVELWDTATGKLLHSLSLNRGPNPTGAPFIQTIASIAFSSDSRMIALARYGDQVVRILEVASWQERLKIAVPLEEKTSLSYDNPLPLSFSVAFSPTSPLLATGGGDKKVRLWNAWTGDQLHEYPGGQGWICSLTFAPDGRSLASGNQNTTALIWDTTPWSKKVERVSSLRSRELESCWSDLASPDAAIAYRVIGKLVAASDQVVPQLAERLRSLATQVAVKPQHVTHLVAKLDSNEFSDRDQAQKELRKMGKEAKPFLRQALKDNPSLEVRRNIEVLLGEIDANEKTVPLKSLRIIRGVEVLEYIGTLTAKQALQNMVEGPPSELREEANAALKRLSN